jgi:hypothetical protein
MWKTVIFAGMDGSYRLGHLTTQTGLSWLSWAYTVGKSSSAGKEACQAQQTRSNFFFFFFDEDGIHFRTREGNLLHQLPRPSLQSHQLDLYEHELALMTRSVRSTTKRGAEMVGGASDDMRPKTRRTMQGVKWTTEREEWVIQDIADHDAKNFDFDDCCSQIIEWI